MNFIKKCTKCGREFNESEYTYSFCEACGSRLIEKVEENCPGNPKTDEEVWGPFDGQKDQTPKDIKEPIPTPEDNVKLLGDILAIDSLGYIHMIEEPYNEEINDANQSLQIFINDKLINSEPIIYDETTIGRHSTSFNPDIDLGKIDPEKMISRKHAMIYRANGKYYLRNLSSKNTLHLNEEPIAQEESKELNNGDLIIFSNYIITKFIKSTY